ncbi:MAG: NUDIX domain-containing protein [Treponema sp.]|jgi:8-oxo-dGTP pyrophosphatase MutT (NUDIX family)|nr:NUDIX domain-containing protein [Treponema sp.]
MKELFKIDLKDYKDTDRHFKRPSVRGIILAEDGKIALVYSKIYRYFKFPGGGIKEDEDKIQALVREVSEEVGMKVIPSSIIEFGSVLRLQKSNYEENTVFEQENFYYFCKVEDSIGKQTLDDYEKDAGFELRIVDIDYAVKINSECKCEDFFDQIMVDRERKVLEMLHLLFKKNEQTA